jgi:hypothetical protein
MYIINARGWGLTQGIKAISGSRRVAVQSAPFSHKYNEELR